MKRVQRKHFALEVKHFYLFHCYTWRKKALNVKQLYPSEQTREPGPLLEMFKAKMVTEARTLQSKVLTSQYLRLVKKDMKKALCLRSKILLSILMIHFMVKAIQRFKDYFAFYTCGFVTVQCSRQQIWFFGVLQGLFIPYANLNYLRQTEKVTIFWKKIKCAISCTWGGWGSRKTGKLHLVKLNLFNISSAFVCVCCQCCRTFEAIFSFSQENLSRLSNIFLLGTNK